jgi:hypothetical protein
MLAYRTTWIVKPRGMKKALEFNDGLIENLSKVEVPGLVSISVYTPRYSPNVLVFEAVWESAEEQNKFWTRPDVDEIWDRDKWFELVENHTGTELWNVTRWDAA